MASFFYCYDLKETEILDNQIYISARLIDNTYTTTTTTYLVHL